MLTMTPPPRAQGRQGRPAQVEDGVEVDRQGFGPDRVRRLLGAAVVDDPGVVDQQVEAAEAFDRGRDQGPAGAGLREVAEPGGRPAAGRRDAFLHGRRARPIAAGQHDRVAPRGQLQRDGRADARGRAGDQRRFAAVFHGPSPPTP
jgi:hypothetical protein